MTSHVCMDPKRVRIGAISGRIRELGMTLELSLTYCSVIVSYGETPVPFEGFIA